MCCEICGIAESTAGHDKGRLFAAVKICGGTVYLADGGRRRLSSPKKKNAKHVIFLQYGGLEAAGGKKVERITDAAVRRMLAALRARNTEKDQGGT